MNARKQLLVTVGTTEFDDLIKSLDCEEFWQYTRTQMYTHIIFQIGRGAYEPSYLAGLHLNGVGGIQSRFSWFRFVPDLSSVVRECDTVISHCGAGTILEVLESGARLIVAVNETLMDNHQMELADALSAGSHCQVIRPATAIRALLHANASLPSHTSRQDRGVNSSTFTRVLDETLGFAVFFT